MMIKEILVRVDDGTPLGGEAHITIGRAGGELTYQQFGAHTRILAYTQPIAEAVLELVHENEIQVEL